MALQLYMLSCLRTASTQHTLIWEIYFNSSPHLQIVAVFLCVLTQQLHCMFCHGSYKKCCLFYMLRHKTTSSSFFFFFFFFYENAWLSINLQVPNYRQTRQIYKTAKFTGGPYVFKIPLLEKVNIWLNVVNFSSLLIDHSNCSKSNVSVMVKWVLTKVCRLLIMFSLLFPFRLMGDVNVLQESGLPPKSRVGLCLDDAPPL